MEKLGKRDLEDILVGCTYLGCGGGGSLDDALKLVYDDLEAGLTFRLMSVQEMEDEEYAATAYGLGSMAAVSDHERERYRHLPRLDGSPVHASFRLLERHMGKKFVAVIVGEVGPDSASASLSIAAHLGIATLDADAVGRATPEIDQYSLLAAGVPAVPAAAVSPFGDEILLQSVAHPSREEPILRAVSIVSESNLGVTDGAITGKIAKRPGVLVVGSVNRARAIGRAFRSAVATHEDPILAVQRAGDGYRLFEGRVTEFSWKDQGGFLVGDVSLSGSGRYSGSRYRIEYKNEHLISWRDGQVSVTCPDLITIVDDATGEAIANPEFERGQAVTVIGYRAPELWRTPRGLELFGPRHFGYDVPYLPIEERLKDERTR